MENTKTTFRSILFSTPMVQAILEGRKTMTRRTKGLEEINKNPNDWEFWRFFNGHAKICQKDNVLNEKFIKCPYEVGDVFWVRETFFDATMFLTAPIFQHLPYVYAYKANDDFIGDHKWKPSLFMPKEACRIFLRIKFIRVEKLNTISADDIIKEGAPKLNQNQLLNAFWAELWCSINGRASWDSNPFVFVYEFERIEKPLDFIV